MVNLRRIEKRLEAKGVKNIEVTKDGKDYYVLHICQNNNPVPLFKTEDKAELLNYLDVEYGIGEQAKWQCAEGHISLEQRLFCSVCGGSMKKIT